MIGSLLRRAKLAAFRTVAISGRVNYRNDLHVGPFTRVWAPNSLLIGSSVYIGKNVTIEVDGQIGDGVLIANNVGIVGRLDHDPRDLREPIRNARWVGDHPDLSHPTVIGSDVWIGFGAVILSGVTVGDSAIVGAGQIVKHDVPSNSIVTGPDHRTWRTRFSESEFREHWTYLKKSGIRPVAQR